MRVLFIGLNYDPEPIGIAVYSTGLCQRLVELGHEVTAIVAKPYYPQWRVLPEYAAHRPISREGGVEVKRVGLYVPARPTGARRLLHHLSFAVSVSVSAIYYSWRSKPDIIVTVAPSLASAPIALLAAKMGDARSWLHIQDLEVEAAIALGLLPGKSWIGRIARQMERVVLRSFDDVSSISAAMCRTIDRSRRARRPARLFRNWATIDTVSENSPPSKFKSLTTEGSVQGQPHEDPPTRIVLYSGNIANKQGIEIVIEAARLLQDRNDVTFVICGEGPNLPALRESARDLGNVRFEELQPAERLGEFLATASIHLLPQRADAADLVLPSKLTNMLASARAIVATAAPGTALAEEVEGCGLVTSPGDTVAFADAIKRLLDDDELRDSCARAAGVRAQLRWNREVILDDFAAALQLSVDRGRGHSEQRR